MNISIPWPLSRFSAGGPVNPAVDPTSTLRRPSSIASLLRFYETPGVPPPSSRVDPLLQQRGGHVMSLRDVLRLGGLIALKGKRTDPEIFTARYVTSVRCAQHALRRTRRDHMPRASFSILARFNPFGLIRYV